MNKRIKIALALIIIILLLMLVISVAYSRYFTKVTGTGNAVVAKWSFKVNGQSDNLGTITLEDTTANSKVADGKIAPGTSGSFDVLLDASGTEVALDYIISFSNITGTIPTNLKFYETKNDDGTYTDEISDIATQEITGTIGLDDSTKTKTVTIYWNWDYQTGTDDEAKETNDEEDTTAGTTAESITFDVIVTGTQKNS